MLRYSLGSLFLALLYLSVGCAALVNATGIWPQVAITLTVAILVLFSLSAIFWTERRRVFAIGFTATGWLYFLLVFSDVTSVRPYLLTETALNRLFTTMHGEQNATYGLVVRTAWTPNGPAGVQTAVYTVSVPIPGVPGPYNGNFTPAPVYSAPGVRPAPPTAYLSLAAGQPFVDSRSFANR